uniref:Ion_trans domain-containing protein n=1 Tax=Heterorhabditis bacteriophora TaxID=37862 RepID=A0A1I7WPA3_HETBA
MIDTEYVSSITLLDCTMLIGAFRNISRMYIGAKINFFVFKIWQGLCFLFGLSSVLFELINILTG